MIDNDYHTSNALPSPHRRQEGSQQVERRRLYRARHSACDEIATIRRQCAMAGSLRDLGGAEVAEIVAGRFRAPVFRTLAIRGASAS